MLFTGGEDGSFVRDTTGACGAYWNSVDAYTAANRADLAEGESAEIAILSAYMPEQMSDADVDALVAEAISATGAASAKEMGKVMGWLGPKTKGRVDGKVLSGKATAALAARG